MAYRRPMVVPTKSRRSTVFLSAGSGMKPRGSEPRALEGFSAARGFDGALLDDGQAGWSASCGRLQWGHRMKRWLMIVGGVPSNERALRGPGRDRRDPRTVRAGSPDDRLSRDMLRPSGTAST